MLLTRADVLASIDTEKFSEIRRRFTNDDGGPGPVKYLDLARWIDVNLRRARVAGLDAAGPPRRVLDLGCGCGYFVHIARLLGHSALGVDRKDHPSSVLVQMRELLGVPCVVHNITPDSPPPVDAQWDVVTAHMVCFNGHCTDYVWGPTEWAKLFDAIRSPVWSIELNAEPDGDAFPHGLRRWFEMRGAQVSGHRVLLTRGGAAR